MVFNAAIPKNVKVTKRSSSDLEEYTSGGVHNSPLVSSKSALSSNHFSSRNLSNNNKDNREIPAHSKM